MSKCPVCEKKLSEPIPPFCPTCGWDLNNDLTLVPSIGGIPEKIVKEYRQRLSLARKNWKAREESERERREMEKKLKMFETQLAEAKRLAEENKEADRLKQEYEAELNLYKKRLSEAERHEVEKKEAKRRNKELEEKLKEVSWQQDQQKKEWIEPITGMVFVHVPAGRFMMGDTFGDGYDNEKPVHEVELDAFYIGKYPVTQGQWKKVMGNFWQKMWGRGNPSSFKKGDDYPVECVSWHDAVGFIEKLKEMNGGRYEFHLPSEAQWEYAARSGGKKERYAGGEDPEGVAWYRGNSGGSTHPVGKKRPNGLGIYDMSGNVLEWCQDIYDGNAYKNHANKKNPIYASGGSSRVFRGGSWLYDPRYVRCACRYILTPADRYYVVGFRLARK